MKQSSLHVAIIMDGNGRWATDLGLPRVAGHRAGAEALRRVVQAAPDLGIGTLTAYAFSADNWKRPAEEVEALMALLSWYLEVETPRMVADGVRISVIGRRDRLPECLLDAIRTAEAMTRDCRKVHLRLAIDYSAREAIVRASQRCGGPEVTLEGFERLLGNEQPVDLLIRTGGEQRLSDFLLWECAYAELVFSRVMWPEYGVGELKLALAEFRRRERRFGGIPVPRTRATGQERWLQ
ncbi:MAG TPA: di-trans,poly-cis-decaprenylcistransferase [Bryobacteraceae bacterium]|nr:di-trans,poly-cis-decaprenylcistransferase [Bryobacteraceae bacterium]